LRRLIPREESANGPERMINDPCPPDAGRTRFAVVERFGNMSDQSTSSLKPVERRKGNKATMDQPQEEFITDQSVPSHRKTDQDHGEEVEKAKPRAEEHSR
jgi:hypothetical protein